ncbi:lipid-A-disaccharide synthase [Striga asiatica]|uniref:Lipid-A-disaccharide synthase n=1 Tax=Striga asiatica TaxID=4170 RepID=A0A5A7PKE4_STRAF|nr:lipid-A-disaccharide synthase [Striga asiatica]
MSCSNPSLPHALLAICPSRTLPRVFQRRNEPPSNACFMFMQPRAAHRRPIIVCVPPFARHHWARTGAVGAAAARPRVALGASKGRLLAAGVAWACRHATGTCWGCGWCEELRRRYWDSRWWFGETCGAILGDGYNIGSCCGSQHHIAGLRTRTRHCCASRAAFLPTCWMPANSVGFGLRPPAAANLD